MPFRVTPPDLRDINRKSKLTTMTPQTIRSELVLNHAVKVQQACLDFASNPKGFETFMDKAASEHNPQMVVTLGSTPDLHHCHHLLEEPLTLNMRQAIEEFQPAFQKAMTKYQQGPLPVEACSRLRDWVADFFRKGFKPAVLEDQAGVVHNAQQEAETQLNSVLQGGHGLNTTIFIQILFGCLSKYIQQLAPIAACALLCASHYENCSCSTKQSLKHLCVIFILRVTDIYIYIDKIGAQGQT